MLGDESCIGLVLGITARTGLASYAESQTVMTRGRRSCRCQELVGKTFACERRPAGITMLCRGRQFAVAPVIAVETFQDQLGRRITSCSTMRSNFESVRASYEAAGQGHVFTFYDSLSASEQEALLAQLATIDPARVNEVYQLAVASESSSSSSSSPSDEIAPPPAGSSESPTDNPSKEAEWAQVGMDAIKQGKVAVILLAGGQGTRLGSSDPKGCYDIGLPSLKSLFQLQAERIQRLQILADNAVIPWYIMTSGPTRKATEAFFEKNSFFGLNKENVLFFDQGVLPCLTTDGKIFLDTKSSVAVAPDGNGGIYAALRSTSATRRSYTVLEDMHKRNVQYIYTYCVDNCLARVADPVFLGNCISKKAQCGTKVVRKSSPTESVGVVALKGGKWNVIEYSEISKELSEAKDEQGDLLYRAANIANHFYDLSFLDKVESFGSKMAYHIARKKIPHVDLQSGNSVKPDKPNGMKLELFIFDVLPFLDPLSSHALFEVERSKEFSPLKNAPGTASDNPETSRRDLLQLQKSWLEKAGASVQGEIEIGPLVSYSGERLESFKGKTLKAGKADSLQELEALVV